MASSGNQRTVTKPDKPSGFGIIVRRHRLSYGMSQNQLAKLTGIDAAYVNRIERSPATPTRAVVLRLAAALALEGVPKDRFLWAAGYAPDHDYISEALTYRDAANVLIEARKQALKEENLYEG